MCKSVKASLMFNFSFRNVRPHLENLHKCIQSMDGKRKKDTKVVETKEKTKSPKSEGEFAQIFQNLKSNVLTFVCLNKLF